MESKTVTREALYEQVWETPLTTLAPSYGVSDVALAKVCRKLNVPVPGRGYWAKVGAGKTVKKPSLPTTGGKQEATIRPRPRPTVRPEEVLPQPETVAKIGKIEIPSASERSHPLVTNTRRHFADIQRRLARHAKRGPNARYVSGDWPPHAERGRFSCSSRDGLSLTVSFATLDRALRILDALARALTKQGFSFEQPNSDDGNQQHRRLTGSLVVKDCECLGFHLREGYTRRERSSKELLDAEKNKQYVTKHEYIPNGSLTLKLQGREYRVSESFRDGKKEKLEEQLGRIVATFADAVPRQQQLRAEREAQALAHREAEHQRWIDQERVREQTDRLEKLLAEAERARRFQILRRYLNGLERAVLRDGELSEEGKKWLSDTRALVDAFDPTMERLGRR